MFTYFYLHSYNSLLKARPCINDRLKYHKSYIYNLVAVLHDSDINFLILF